MSHPLQNKVAAVRRRARRMVLLHGLGRVVAAVVAVALALGLADYLIRFQDPGIRLIASAALLATFGWTTYRHLLLPLARNLRDVDVARWIERRHPRLNDRLSSAIEFLKQRPDDPTAGSAALRRAVIHEAEVETGRLDLDAVIDRRPTKRALAVAGVVALAALMPVVLAPSLTGLALARLALPLGAARWPREHHLAFKNPPTRLAAGKPFEVELIDRNRRLPDEVRIHYRFDDGAGGWIEKVEKMRFAGGAMIARRDGVTRPFEYRAEGGDDDTMEWIALEVIEPPAVESFEVVLHPPAYTGWGPTKSDKRIRALQGTRVAIRGATTKPLASARLKLDGGREIAAKITRDGFGFEIAPEDFTLDKSGTYRFALVDREGVAGAAERRGDIRVVPDAPPTVTIERPATGVFVTPRARVPLRILVKDDLAVRDVVLAYSRSDRSEEGEFTETLYEGPPKVAPDPRASLTDGRPRGESRVLEKTWNLAELNLAPGTQLAVLARARDYLPQTGQTLAPRRITIITPAQLEDRLAQRQAFILSELARALKMQQEVRKATAAARIQLGEVGRLAQRDIDDLRAAELSQRQVHRALADPAEGVPLHIAGLLADLENNRLDNPDIERRMREVLREIERLDRDALPVVRRELTSAIKTGEAAPDAPAARLDESLATAEAAEDEVIATLERLLGDLSQWTDYRRFARETRQIRQDQEELRQRSQKIGRETLTKSADELTPEQRAELQKIARAQLDLSRRLDKTLQDMEAMAGELDEKDPLAAATLADALHLARQKAIGGKMRQAGRDAAENRMGQAVRRQGEVNEDLDALLDILANRREHELARLVEKLRAAEEKLTQLREQQKGLQKKRQAAEQEKDAQKRERELKRLRREQEQLEKEIERFARRLKRLNAERAARAAGQGAAHMGQSRAAGEKGDAAAANAEAKQAERDLEQAQEQLAQARRKAELDLAREQLARFEDTLRGMIGRQRRMLEDTARLDAIRQTAGDLTRAQTLSLDDLARGQEQLAAETAGQGEKLKTAEVFQLALDGAARLMRDASELLLKRQTGEPTRQCQQNALARLEQIKQALAADEENQGQDQNQGGQGGQGGGGRQGQNGGQIRSLAELKLLKLLQQDLRRRTVQTREETAGKETLTDARRRQLERLADEQGRLAELVFDLLQPAAPQTKNDPEALPDLDEAFKEEGLPPLDLLPGGELP